MANIDTGYVIVAADVHKLPMVKRPVFAEGDPETVPPARENVSKFSYRCQPIDLFRRAAAVERGLPSSRHGGAQVLFRAPLTLGEVSLSRREMFASKTPLRRMTVTAEGHRLQHGSAAGGEEGSQVLSDRSDGLYRRQRVRGDQIPV